jgi:xanthine dehydrogenase molybdopterin-binding subunit B
MIFTEGVIEAVATSAGADPIDVQGAHLADAQTKAVWIDMLQRSDFAKRKAAVVAFNSANRWSKHGIWCTPVKYVRGNREKEMVVVSVKRDGSILVDCSGIEMGQGLNTKVVQAVVVGLNKLTALPPAFSSSSSSSSAAAAVPLLTMADVHVGRTKSTDQFPHAGTTNASGTSEGCVDAALKVCAQIVTKLAPYTTTTGSTQPVGAEAWAAIVARAFAAGVDLSAGLEGDHLTGGNYDIYTAACTEVKLDVLTGQYTVLQADLVYDAGVSLNPSLDIGQVEGCYIMAMGMCLTEHQTRSTNDHRLLSNGTWDLKIPSVLDIPVAFNVTLTQNASTETYNILGSKCATEPGMVLAASAFFALKQAVYAARKSYHCVHRIREE